MFRDLALGHNVALFVAGMLERRERTLLRLGIDSVVAICVYAAGIVVLYHLR